MAHLTLVLQGREVRRYVLNPARTTIGRAQDNDIVINNLALSRHHAEVSFQDGAFELRDHQSQNGVFVNRERVKGSRVLRDADTITLGTYDFVFSLGASETPLGVPRVRHDSLENTHLSDRKPPSPRSGGQEKTGDMVPTTEAVALLVLKYNDVELQKFPLRRDLCVIGRGKDCDVQIAERRLSRRHCEIRRDGGRFLVRDLGSQNGSYVNRGRIEHSHELRDGDILNFAEYSVQFLEDASRYSGPDRIHAHDLPNHSPSKEQRAHADVPEASMRPDRFQAGAPGRGAEIETPVHPSEGPEDPSASVPKAPVAMRPRPGTPPPGDPIVEAPRNSRKRREVAVEAHREVRGVRRDPIHGRAPHTPGATGPSSTKPSPKKSAFPGPSLARDRLGRPMGAEEPTSGKPTLAAETSDSREVAADSPLEGVPVARADAARHLAPDGMDVDDARGDVRPDPGLAEWYGLRREASSLHGSDPAVLLDRGPSSVSQVLSTMMVDKRDLDRNLRIRTRERRFGLEVLDPTGRRMHRGLIDKAVTVLGSDPDSDVLLNGRFVAGRHSLLVRVLDSLLLVRLGSSSATRVNGLPKLQAFLKAGDVVLIDETTIRIYEE